MTLAKENILVTGANGQLGSELKQLASSYPKYNFFFTDRSVLSVTDKQAIDIYFRKNNIQHCINCAAYTAVDKAEEEKEISELINGTAVGYLAEATKKFNASFIHISTDYVFKGDGEKPYKETDSVSPVNAYGHTKLLGEKLALSNNPQSIIIRTSWLYSSHGKNFVKTMKKLMHERSEISVVTDQYGSPTYAADLAEAIMEIINSGKAKTSGGIYQFSNSGIISWYQFAEAIQKLLKLDCIVKPIPSSAYPTPAARPAYSALDNQKLTETFGISQKPWLESLSRCLNLMN